MALDFDRIVWSTQSELDLDAILDYYLKVSPDKAHSYILHILDETEKIVFSEQWQMDEFDPSCRRAFIDGKFRVLYKVIEKTVLVTRVYPTQKNPDGILKK
jgi:plasmid stabilization system protein ParE